MISALVLLALAAAPPQKLVLVTFLPGSGVEVSSLHRALGLVVRTRPGLELLTEEEAFAEGDDATRALERCGPERTCLEQLLQRRGLELALLAVVDTRLDPPLLSAQLVRVGKDEVRPSVVLEAPRARIEEVFRTITARALDEAGFVEGAELVIEVDPVDAIVAIRGAQETRVTGASAQRIVLPAGVYTVTVSHSTRAAQHTHVELRRGETRSLSVVLAEPAAATPIHERWWFWGAIGLAAAGIAASAVVLTRDSPHSCVCARNGGAACPPGC